MKAIYLDEVRKFSEKDIPKPIPTDDQVLVQIKAVGVCGSDVHYWDKGRIGPFVVDEPLVLGHECAGVVVEAGKDVKHLKPGDRVVIEPGAPCYKCENCLSGRYNLCADLFFFATPPDDGCFMEYVSFDANMVYKIPDDIDDFGVASMVEPLAVGVYAVDRIKPKPGDKAIVFGAGIIGIACLLAAKAAGCSEVWIADIRDDRLAKAEKFAPFKAINTTRDKLEENYFDIGLDATGAEACYTAAVKVIKPGGRLQLVGMGAEIQNLPLVDYICKEIDLLTTFRYCNSHPQALRLISANQEQLKGFITHRIPFTLEGIEEGMEISLSDPEAGKVVIELE
jgi:L-iditol 2-dehydrogenase